MWIVILILTIFGPAVVDCVTAVGVPLSQARNCSWTPRWDWPEVYWINMDKSKQRRANIERHLDEIGFRHFRVRGLTPQEIFIPPDIEASWRTSRCTLETVWIPPDKLNESFPYHQGSNGEWTPFTSYTSSLCGRGKKKNSPKELGCTTSHLYAMRQAIYSPTARSRYALIVEDDVQFPFDVDFNAMTGSAPKGFGILQLFNSNEGSMEVTFNKYRQDPNHIWIDRHPVKFDFWSTCAYLIDRVVMKPVIDAVASYHHGWIDFKIVAGINSPCVPAECCVHGEFKLKPPCVFAPRGYQADSFLYAMTKTYALSIPVITNGLGTNQSTFHQDHVEMLHKKAFRRQRQYINELYGEVKPPSFMKPACTVKLDVNMIG